MAGTWMKLRAALVCALVVAGQAASAQAGTPQGWQAEVFAAERAFAKSMADRDFAAFGRLVASDTLFFGNAKVHRGRDAVLAAWKGFFDGPRATFSWEPDQVEVLDSGQLALYPARCATRRARSSRATTRSGCAWPMAAG